ncbi:MAG TPA: CDP-diacylglycerol--glycerol-3-phosphate 3-phosphatidyltransferase [Cryptosporangiaceae bacterium]|nr:CDP-diacylglycerol--glycerol-3-phosphate 3-phosphatidyltransferase [Cryptosporangiaceae bacterium]
MALTPGPPLVNVANLLTTLRLLLVPVVAVMLVVSDGTSVPWRIGAALVFAVASITDLYDGRLARSRNLVTTFGQVADPIADKALIGAALIGLSWLGALPWWITAVILVREVGVTGLRFWVIRHGVIPASRGGKLKTLLQAVAICWYLWPWPEALAAFGPFIMGAAVVVTVLTGGDYVVRALVLRRTSARATAAIPAPVALARVSAGSEKLAVDPELP